MKWPYCHKSGARVVPRWYRSKDMIRSIIDFKHPRCIRHNPIQYQKNMVDDGYYAAGSVFQCGSGLYSYDKPDLSQ
jgi:hypothetical protein